MDGLGHTDAQDLKSVVNFDQVNELPSETKLFCLWATAMV